MANIFISPLRATVHVHRSYSPSLKFFTLLLLVILRASRISGDRADGMYSFSLSTFDTQGKLGQVERALDAASQGAPVIGFVLPEGICLACPQVLPSPLMEDDGTRRFAMVTPEIFVSHSGLSADGRVLLAAAERLAMEHRHTFEEDIPMEIFLEELSLLYQEYTMKPAARPFGCLLLVGYLPRTSVSRAKLFRIDPSGSIQGLGNDEHPAVIINGQLEGSVALITELETLSKAVQSSEQEFHSQVPDALASCLRSALREQTTKLRKEKEDSSECYDVLTACLTREGRFSVQRK